MGTVYALASGKGGVGKSLAYGEFVSLANGSVIQIGSYIDELIEKRKAEVKQLICKTVEGKEEVFEVLIPSSDLILDTVQFNDKTQKISSEINIPLALMRKPAPKKLIDISCASGSVSVTPEHKFIIMRNGVFLKVRADEIKEKKDYLVLLNSTNSVKFLEEKVPVETAELLGYLIGDGYMEGFKLHVFCAPNSLLPKIRKSFEKVFGSYKENVSRNLHRISFYRTGTVKELYEKYGVKISTAEGKEVPKELCNSSNKSVAAFIRALFDCDGSAHISRRQIEFDSKSKKLVFEVASLLRTRFGILSQIKQTFKIAKNGKMKEKGEYWRLHLTGRNAGRFAEFIGFNDSQKQAKILKQINNQKTVNTNIDLYPVGKILKQIREEANISAPKIAKTLNCSKQMIYEYEWQYYALSKEKTEKYIKSFEALSVKNEKLEWLKDLINSNILFRRVERVNEVEYDNPFVYDFQVSDQGGHFTHATGIIVSNTTITANLGIALAQRGKKVLLVDADIAMANLSLLLGMHSSPITLHDVLLGESSLQDAIYDGPGGISFVPSGLSFESYRRVDSARLSGVIASVKDDFDYILLDAPAGIETNVMSALSASDNVLLITMPVSPSIADVLKTKIVAERLGAKPIGIIVNFVRNEKGEVMPDDIMKMLELPIYGSVPYDDDIRKSFMREKIMPTILFKPNSKGVEAINVIAEKLTGVPTTIKFKKKGPITRFLNKLFSIFKRKPKQSSLEKEIKKTKEKPAEFDEELPEISEDSIELQE
ncbi:cell division ATPase MinD [Candidatus Micrarchaeota archaeon]|nr:cell division ATPase MinD [Candidatus Micrarchaeota archaeon]